jgi:hypothetical protein
MEPFRIKIDLPDATGVVGDSNGYLVANETQLRVAQRSVSSGYITLVQGLIYNDTTWTTLATLVGPSISTAIDISAYDFIRFNVTTAGSSGGLYVSSFFPKALSSGVGGSNSFSTIQTDLGTSPVATSSLDTLTFTSSDGSVQITGNSTTDTIDLVAVGGGGGGSGTPAISVTDETTYGITKSVGTSTNYARQDHTHGTMATPTKTTVGLSNVQNVDQTNPSNITQDATHRFTNDTDITRLANTSGTNTGDQDLSNLVVKNTVITGATKTKITYDTKGLVTAGADATTADIADSTNKRYVTDANLTTIGNQSGTNTGDNAVNSLYSGLATSKENTGVAAGLISTHESTYNHANIAHTNRSALDLVSGTNTGDETTATIKSKLGAATTSTDGYLTSTDWNTFNGKQAALGYTPANKAGETFTGAISATNLSGTNTGDQTISDATISTSDITTNNATTSKHGFLPKLGGGTTNFLRADGTWAAPSGGGGSGSSVFTASTTVDFGTSDDLVSATVAATWADTTKTIVLSILPNTTDHDYEDVIIEQLSCTYGNIVNGVSFDVFVHAPETTWGRYIINAIGV